MEETVSNKTISKAKEENRNRDKLRSSLKKSSKNPFGNLDASDECEDVTLAPPPRRVSFAASSTVKPFVNDPEKNTIWDNTYEEEINNHTDSVNGISIDTYSNIQEINITKHQKKPTLRVIEPPKSLEANPMLTQTITEPSDMELTCQFTSENIVFKETMDDTKNTNRTIYQELDMSMTCKFTDILNKENIVPNIITNVEQSIIDMEFTCQIARDHQNLAGLGSSKKAGNKVQFYSDKSLNHSLQRITNPPTFNHNNTDFNKENIFSEKLTDIKQSALEMEFTCQFPQKPLQVASKAAASTRVIEPVKNQSSAGEDPQKCGSGAMKKNQNLTQFTDNIELTCHSLNAPQNIVANKENKFSEEIVANVEQSAMDMEFTCQFPERPLCVSTHMRQSLDNLLSTAENPPVLVPGASKKARNAAQFPDDMELTGHLLDAPQTIVSNKENIFSEKIVADVEQSVIDMEFTCQFSQKTFEASSKAVASTHRIGNLQMPGPGALEEAQNMYDNKTRVPNDETAVSGIDKSVIDMPFCQVPENSPSSTNVQLSILKKSKKIQNLQADLEGTILGKENVYPEKNVSEVEKSAINMEFTNHFPQFSENLSNKPDCIGAVTLAEKNSVAAGIFHDSQWFTQVSLKPSNQENTILNKENIVHGKNVSTRGQTATDLDVLQNTSRTVVGTVASGNDPSVRNLTHSILNNQATNRSQLNSNNHLAAPSAGPVNDKDLITVDSVESNKFAPESVKNISGPKIVKAEKFGAIPIAIDCTNVNCTDYDDAHNAVSIVSIPPNISGPTATFKPILDKCYSIGSPPGILNDFVIRSATDATDGCSEINENFFSDEYKNIFSGTSKNETIDAQECNLVDTPSLIEEPEQIISPPKVIYSQPMKTANISSIDTTQQLLEATISKLTIPLDDSDEDVRVQQIFNNVRRNGFVQYRPLDFDFASCSNLISEYKKLRDNVKAYLEETHSSTSKPRRSRLDEQVRRLSLATNTSSADSLSASGNDSLLKYPEDEVNNANPAIDIPKSLHERIIDIFDNTGDHILKLQHNEENYYIFSTFAQAIWFSAELHPDCGRVVEIQSLSARKDESKCLFPSLYNFIIKHTRNKLEMCNLKSCLGNYFDMLSLLDHVNMITEKSFEFCIEFITIQRKYYKTLEIDVDGTVSFEILVEKPAIWWTIQFALSSLENIQPDSLRVMSKWGKINEEHIKTILMNTEPGIDCIKRFIQEVIEYFKRVQMKKIR